MMIPETPPTYIVNGSMSLNGESYWRLDNPDNGRVGLDMLLHPVALIAGREFSHEQAQAIASALSDTLKDLLESLHKPLVKYALCLPPHMINGAPYWRITIQPDDEMFLCATAYPQAQVVKLIADLNDALSYGAANSAATSSKPSEE